MYKKRLTTFDEFKDLLSEIQKSIHQLGERTSSGDSSFLKLFSRTMEAALAGADNEGVFVFVYQKEKRERVYFSLLMSVGRKSERPNPTEHEMQALQLANEVVLLCEEAQAASLEWLPEQAICLYILRQLGLEFKNGVDGIFFSTTLTTLFEKANESANLARKKVEMMEG